MKFTCNIKSMNTDAEGLSTWPIAYKVLLIQFACASHIFFVATPSCVDCKINECKCANATAALVIPLKQNSIC